MRGCARQPAPGFGYGEIDGGEDEDNCPGTSSTRTATAEICGFGFGCEMLNGVLVSSVEGI